MLIDVMVLLGAFQNSASLDLIYVLKLYLRTTVAAPRMPDRQVIMHPSVLKES